jgi:carbon monoxide dehydrogenase subunit G
VGSPYVIDYRRSFLLPAPPEDVWAAIERVDDFESRWAWLRDFRVEGPGLTAGSVLHGVVVPPLPYRMRLRVALVEWAPPRRIEATVHGDLEGRARLSLEGDGDETWAEVAWTIEMTQRSMRLSARVAHPLLRWGHDRVVFATVAGFRQQLLADGNAA